MHSHAEFVSAILDQWDDDTPRLIYADWLEERGDPMAEFIRRQIELTKTENIISSGYETKEYLVKELLRKFGSLWLVRMPQFPTAYQYRWERGLPAQMCSNGRGVFIQKADHYRLGWNGEQT